MKLLSIDSAGTTAAVAVSEEGAVLAEGFADEGLTHSQTLLPLTDETLKKAGISLKEIDAFAVTSGPGSFTGLRIGAALVKGMALGRPCYAVPTLMALACNEKDSGRIAVSLLDARRKQVYMGAYAFEAGKPVQVIEDRACSVEEAEALIGGLEGKVVLLGNGAYLLEQVSDGDRVIMSRENHILGRSVAHAAAFLDPIPPERLVPSYLRLSQAEREYQEKKEKEKNGSTGL
ncbi:MAG: tRNA (adenosine(37)-N6)-threonylcarbamoyltransferase complex dimerization subunit type 1 TsaB [Clostridia bacterium]|nr:tRNA (adenosine(37)-N6)-threonylcarbamoyltransferase complex dimerization subunit type 1 TsaB [Clostridia bacterium]